MTDRSADSAVVAVDIGGTAIKASVFDRHLTELASATVPTPVAAGPDAIVDAVVGVIDELRASVRSPIVAVGVIPPGIVDPVAGIARWSANLGWRNVPVRDLVADRVGRPVAVDHDVRLAGRAELQLGAAVDSSSGLFVSIGTGIAAAVIRTGAIDPGATGQAGELGHIPVVPDGEPCACGQRGCLEVYASAAALVRRYRAGLTVADADVEALTAADVLARAEAGDVLAQQVFTDAVETLGRGLVIATLLFDPELIVFGGGLARAGATLLDPVAKALAGGLTWRSAPELRLGRFGADAGRVGAGLLAWDRAGAGR